MQSDLKHGLRVPPFTAFVVVDGTLGDPKEIVYLYREEVYADGIPPVQMNSLADFLNAGYFIVARQYIGTNSTRVVYANANQGTARINFYRRDV